MIFYTGSYTAADSPALHPKGEGIGCFAFDQDAGEITFLHLTPQRNPSYLVVSDDLKYLYALEELPEDHQPKVFAYAIEEKGRLRLLNTQDLRGAYGCHLAIVAGQLIVAHYLSGNAACFPLLPDGTLGRCQQILQHQGKGSHRLRQQSPHIHMVYPTGKVGFYLVDLGTDCIRHYQWNPQTGQWIANTGRDIQVQSGAGARHMVQGPSRRFTYVLGELSGEVYVMERQEKKFVPIQKISVLPKRYKASPGAAAIRIHPNGQFLYASNRGSDTIAIFKIDDTAGLLFLVDHQPAGGRTPRDFQMDPLGNWLIAALQDSDVLVVFAIDPADGRLQQKQKVATATPVNICWLHPQLGMDKKDIRLKQLV